MWGHNPKLIPPPAGLIWDCVPIFSLLIIWDCPPIFLDSRRLFHKQKNVIIWISEKWKRPAIQRKTRIVSPCYPSNWRRSGRLDRVNQQQCSQHHWKKMPIEGTQPPPVLPTPISQIPTNKRFSVTTSTDWATWVFWPARQFIPMKSGFHWRGGCPVQKKDLRASKRRLKWLFVTLSMVIQVLCLCPNHPRFCCSPQGR